MLLESRAAAKECELNIVEEVWVPGSVEKPLAVKRLLLRDDIHGVVVLGIIERGQTKHGLVMGHALMQIMMQMSVDTMKPVGLGVLGPEIEHDQISERLEPYARAAVEAVKRMLE